MDAALRDLTVPDGSCRDINLFGVTRSGAEQLLTWVCSQFESHIGSAYPSDEDVQPIEQADFATPLAAGHMVRGYLERGSVLFDHLQYFVVPEDDGGCFVELTFFPQDLHLDGSVGPIKEWLKSALVTAGASGGFVRVENASFDPAWDRRDHIEVIFAIAAEDA